MIYALLYKLHTEVHEHQSVIEEIKSFSCISEL